ncbi:hypothetical protein [Oxynema aestuarii]|uniref:Uncharacterized protein n=1 Tax=Oxynema aestuarii AP17 TaxID=2064643 RepID=A0A6H1U3T9_9CYAN|nr:hypothetical protein [Oxynema aestuarii]QIZ73096.1 hypothetical protein HCG48_22895 [Oxynema aestuarii AP17]
MRFKLSPAIVKTEKVGGIGPNGDRATVKSRSPTDAIESKRETSPSGGSASKPIAGDRIGKESI